MSCTVFFKDKNLLPENIKKGVKIFRVVGTLEGGGQVNNEDITADPSTSSQSITYSSGYDGIGLFTLLPYVLDTKSLDPSTASQTVTSSEDGMSSVSVSAVTSSIDANITAGNIKQGVSILGVNGTLDRLNWVTKGRLGTLTDLSQYSLGSIVGNNYSCWMMFSDSPITQIPSLGNSSVGQYSLYKTFANCTSLTSVYSDIQSVGAYGLQETFNGCSNLISVSLPNLRSIQHNGALDTFTGCSSLTTVNIHPLAASDSGNDNIITSMLNLPVQHLTLSANVTQDLFIDNLENLDFDSVLNVLNHLDLSVSGHSVYFFVSIQDDAQHTIQNAYDAAVNAGWTINGLNIY